MVGFVNRSSGSWKVGDLKEMALWWKGEEHHHHNGGPVLAATLNGGSNKNGYVSLRNSSASTVNVGGSCSSNSSGGSTFLRCCVYRLANVNIRRWILALVVITVLSIVCYTRLIDAPFST